MKKLCVLTLVLFAVTGECYIQKPERVWHRTWLRLNPNSFANKKIVWKVTSPNKVDANTDIFRTCHFDASATARCFESLETDEKSPFELPQKVAPATPLSFLLNLLASGSQDKEKLLEGLAPLEELGLSLGVGYSMVWFPKKKPKLQPHYRIGDSKGTRILLDRTRKLPYELVTQTENLETTRRYESWAWQRKQRIWLPTKMTIGKADGSLEEFELVSVQKVSF